MFPEKVKSVTLDKSRITYYLQTTDIDNIYNELPVNPEIYKVEDLAFDCSIRSSQYLPDYAIKGYFKVDENLRYPVFIENTNGASFIIYYWDAKEYIGRQRRRISSGFKIICGYHTGKITW